MQIDHVRFCVEDAKAMSRWFVSHLGFQRHASGPWHDCYVEIITAGTVTFVLLSPLHAASAAAVFLQRYAAGVTDVVLQVIDLRATIAQAIAQGATVLQPIQTEQQPQGQLKWATIAAWGSLSHTLVERQGQTTLLPAMQTLDGPTATRSQAAVGQAAMPGMSGAILGIDHVVLNVGHGELASAVAWYERVFGFQPHQAFAIQTKYSALHSQVMRHPSGTIQWPINEPASANSQIQEFLEFNRGAGIQHIALKTMDLITAIAAFRQAGLPLIQVPSTYYSQLRDRPSCPFSTTTLQRLERCQLLVDWQADPSAGVLLQTFTQPIFQAPTFFLELIERQPHPAAREPVLAQGFGEGNFQALFEAIEREQMKRGKLIPVSEENC